MCIFDFLEFNLCLFFFTISVDRMFVLQPSSFKITIWLPASIKASIVSGSKSSLELDSFVFDTSGALLFDGSINLNRPHAQNLY